MKKLKTKLTVAILLVFFVGFLGKANAQNSLKSLRTTVSIMDGKCSLGEVSKAVVFLSVRTTGFEEKYQSFSVKIQKDGKTVEEGQRTFMFGDHTIEPYLLEPGKYTIVTSYKDSLQCSNTFIVRGFEIPIIELTGFDELLNATEARVDEIITEKTQSQTCVLIPGGLSIQPNKEAEIHIYSFSGQKVFSCKAGDDEQIVYLPAGMYIIRNGTESKKVIIQ